MNLQARLPLPRTTAFQQQLNVVVTVGVLLFAIVSSLLTSWQGSRQIRDTLLQQGTQIAESLATRSALALLYSSPENAQDAIDATLAFPDIAQAEILRADGSILVARGRRPVATRTPPMLAAMPDHAHLAAESDGSWHFVAPVFARVSASQFDTVDSREELLGFVRVEQSKASLSRMQKGIVMVNLAISLLFAAVLLIALHHLAGRLTRPIMALSETMARAERGEMHIRAGLDGPRDIVEMAMAFNRMIGSLQDRERLARQVRDIEAAHTATRIIAERERFEREQQRRFLAMLTHELKTPLSVIRMCLGAAHPSPRMQMHADNAITDIDVIVDRVALATRIEDQSLYHQVRDCQLDELLTELRDQQLQAERVRLELPSEADALRLTTDPLLLRTALGNLLDNALKYAPGSATVRIAASPRAEGERKGIAIRVENPVGPSGWPDPAHLFEKYYRAPGARTQSGSGLGLYIVQELVRLLDGRIRYLDARPDVCFEVWLPATPVADPPSSP